ARPTPCVGEDRSTEVDLRAFANKQSAVQALIHSYRMLGSRMADLDPLKWAPAREVPELTPAFHGLSNADESLEFDTDTAFSQRALTLRAIRTALERTYCGTLGPEFQHLSDTVQRRFWQTRLESTRSKPAFERTM